MSRHHAPVPATLRILTAVLAGAIAFVLAPSPARSASAPEPRSFDHTHRVVVRPVDASGHAVDGWTVKRERDGTVDSCDASMSSVSDDVYLCYPTVEYAVACWKSHDKTLLCLRDPRSRELVRLSYTGRLGHVSAPATRVPLALTLRHGQQCQMRFGGAWGTPSTHQDWAGYDSCSHGDVYGPVPGDGIDRSGDVWRVKLWVHGTDGTIVTRGVRTAYLVGTAA